ncbi:hypothetical protein U1Q18_034525, partial [Sarracenia purpurea var. burkii]
ILADFVAEFTWENPQDEKSQIAPEPSSIAETSMADITEQCDTKQLKTPQQHQTE